LGNTIELGGSSWTVVGVFDAGGSAFDSEIWCDADLLNATYQRPKAIFQTVTLRLRAPAELEALKRRIASDPRMRVQAERETDYYGSPR
jgi:putative ABC transport system permease protein